MSHTYAILDVSPATYAEIRAKLVKAEYQHAFDGLVIDMHGIALAADPEHTELEGSAAAALEAVRSKAFEYRVAQGSHMPESWAAHFREIEALAIEFFKFGNTICGMLWDVEFSRLDAERFNRCAGCQERFPKAEFLEHIRDCTKHPLRETVLFRETAQAIERANAAVKELHANAPHEEPSEPLYVLIKGGLYWRPDRCGYTADLLSAGLYSEQESGSYLGPSYGNEISRELATDEMARLADRKRKGFASIEPRMLELFDRATGRAAVNDRLLGFKRYVHERLDRMSVPADPQPAKTALHGCRIEGRIDWVIDEMIKMEDAAEEFSTKIGELEAELEAAAETHDDNEAALIEARLQIERLTPFERAAHYWKGNHDAVAEQLKQLGQSPKLKPLELIHLATAPFVAVCRADYPGMRTTDDRSKANCRACVPAVYSSGAAQFPVAPGNEGLIPTNRKAEYTIEEIERDFEPVPGEPHLWQRKDDPPNTIAVPLTAPPEQCFACKAPIAKFHDGGTWHACAKCGGGLCEKCCDDPAVKL